MADELMYIPNNDTQNYPYCRLQLVVRTLNLINQQIKIQLKSPKLLSQLIRKRYYKTLGTSVINSPMPSLLWTRLKFADCKELI